MRERLRSESPLGRLGRPEDAAEAVAFLLSGGRLDHGAGAPFDGGFGSIRTLRHGRAVP